MFDMLRPGLLAGGILCVALNLILRCKFSQNLPTNDSLKKVPVKLQVPENCILPGFFKILPPRRHSLGQRVRKGCGILSFIPSLYLFIYLLLTHGVTNSSSPMVLSPYIDMVGLARQQGWSILPDRGAQLSLCVCVCVCVCA